MNLAASHRVAAFICLCTSVVEAAIPPKPLWPGSRYTVEDRDRAVERGLQFIYHVASDPRNFTVWGHDLLWCFYSISATAKNQKLREMAYDMGHERALQWRVDHRRPPDDDPGAITNFVSGTDAANRLGVPEGTVLREQVRRTVARFTAQDFLRFTPRREPPPSDVPDSCTKCGHQNPRGATKCEKCNTALTFESRYEVWLDALISTYTGDVYGVNPGASYSDVLRWIKVMRPYPPRAKAGPEEAEQIVYSITHVIYTLNDYGRYRLSRAWLPLEFKYLTANLTAAARDNDTEILGEFMDTLRAFGMSEKDALIRTGVEYQLSHQNRDGSWGDMNEDDIYARYHSTWTAVDGLREYLFQGKRLRRPELMSIIKAGTANRHRPTSDSRLPLTTPPDHPPPAG